MAELLARSSPLVAVYLLDCSFTKTGILREGSRPRTMHRRVLTIVGWNLLVAPMSGPSGHSGTCPRSLALGIAFPMSEIIGFHVKYVTRILSRPTVIAGSVCLMMSELFELSTIGTASISGINLTARKVLSSGKQTRYIPVVTECQLMFKD